MRKISIIVPIYNGNVYLLGMMEQVEKCAEVSGDYNIELVFSNDTPGCPINSDFTSDKMDIKILNTNKNRGIHGARVRGLLNSTGEYIVFLDQDNKLLPEYFSSQLRAIGSADAVVCNALNGGRLKYNTDRPLYKTVSRKSMISEGNMILSPGQVLMKRKAIPDSWVKNVMRQNGADDWLLWLCMHAERKQFAINEAVLFSREVHYYNTSLDSLKMTASEQEAVKMIEQEHLLSAGERKSLRELLPKLHDKRIKENQKWKKMFLIQNDWFGICNAGGSIAAYLADRKITKVAVYGYGYLGKSLLENLEKEKAEVVYVIDKNAAFLDIHKKCYTLNEILEPVEGVIISLVKDSYPELEDKIRKSVHATVMWLEDIVADMKWAMVSEGKEKPGKT